MFHALENKIYIISKKYGQKLGLDLPYFVKNGFWVFLRQGIGAVCGLALSIAFARLAAQEVFGQYQFILSVLSIVSIFSVPGLNTSLTRSVARGFDGDYKKVVRISFLWSLLGIPALFLLGGYYYLYQNHSLGIALMFSSVFFPFFYAPNTWDAFLQGKSKFDISTKYSLIQAIINSLATISIIFFFRNNLFIIMITYFVSYTFFNGYYYLISLKYVENKKKSVDTINYGWFLTKINFLGIVAANIDSILVGILLGPVNLAIYSIVSLVAIKVKDLTKSVGVLFIPKIAKAETSLSNLLKPHKLKILTVFLFAAVFSFLYYFFIFDVNRILFSDKYASYSYLSKIFSVTVFLSTFLSFLSYYSSAKKNKFVIKITNPVFYTTKIIINVFFIYKFGLIGAVVAFNISTILWFILFVSGILYTEKNRISSL